MYFLSVCLRNKTFTSFISKNLTLLRVASMPPYILSTSPQKGKKYQVIFPNGDKVNFGARGYQDYTMHHDETRKTSYIARHRPQENWTASGIKTAGFWSLWLLWNKKTIDASIKDIEKRFGVTIKRV